MPKMRQHQCRSADFRRSSKDLKEELRQRIHSDACQGVQDHAPPLGVRGRAPGCDEAVNVGSQAMPIIEPLSRETENELGCVDPSFV